MNSLIETDRLILRNYNENDLDNVCRLKGEPLIWKFSSQISSSSKRDGENYLDNLLKDYAEDRCNFQALCLKSTGEYIGEAGVLSFNKRCNRAVIGYNLIPMYWGKGYATEITRALIKHLFDDKDVERIEALAMEINRASRRVLEKSGFLQEGFLRNFAYINGSYNNVCYYGIIKDDYNKL